MSSDTDIQVTKTLQKVGEILGIKGKDHLIAGDTLFSFYENNLTLKE